MWKVMMIYPESTSGVDLAPREPTFAKGLVHHVEIEVGEARSLHEAKLKALDLALKTLREQKYKSPVVGYGVRSTLSRPKRGPLYWTLLLPQLVQRIKDWRAYKKERGEDENSDPLCC